jgi:phosphohistidine phosphatase SixA
MLKHLWIMRHGLAVDQFESDFTRALSTTGRLQAENSAEELLRNPKLLPRDMLVSPFQRTLSTADIMHNKLSISAPYETDEMLVHFADHKILGDFLLCSPFSDLLIVSHMPIVAKLCQYLSPSCEIYGFETAQIVRLDFNAESGPTNNARVGQVITPKC